MQTGAKSADFLLNKSYAVLIRPQIVTYKLFFLFVRKLNEPHLGGAFFRVHYGSARAYCMKSMAGKKCFMRPDTHQLTLP